MTAHLPWTSSARPSSHTAALRKIVVQGSVAGLILFVVQNLALWAAWLWPAPGHRPLFYISGFDDTQYLGYLALARNHWLFPNLHAPWVTEPAMLHPLFLTVGRLGAWLGASPVVMFNAAQVLMYILAAVALAFALNVFLTSRAQRIAALLVALSAIPVTMFVLAVVRWLVPATDPLFWLGVIELDYSSADGLLRGGLSNSPTLSFGTAMMLLALTLMALRLSTKRKSFTRWMAVVAFASAFVHPFEVFVIGPAVGLAFLLLERSAWTEILWVAAGATLGIAPHLFLLSRHVWMSEASQIFSGQENPVQVAFTYGIPFLAIPYLFLMRARLQNQFDKLLLIWWLTSFVVSLLPHAPFPPHLRNGFSVVTALLLVRLASGDAKLVQLYQSRPRLFQTIAAAILAIVAFGYVGMYTQIVRDARTEVPEYLLSAAAESDQLAVVDEFRKMNRPQDLALAPGPLAWLLIQAPVHSFASHQHLSYNYEHQVEESNRFYEGKFSTAEASKFLGDYGIRWVVVPKSSPAIAYFAEHAPRFTKGNLTVFELPQHQMKPYPGVKAMSFAK